ncbi:MAG: alkaline phosphatase D family protein [Planctomycetota bacterium]|nr:alkaline phosphatase D family protein [Planctomycetota bacterium]
MMRLIAGFIAAVVLSTWCGSTLFAAHMAMGFRVGEVTHTSAIVWTRVTKNAERNRDGYRDPMKRERHVDRYVASEIKVEDREGATPGAEGQVRVAYSTDESFRASVVSNWETVKPDHDFVHQFRLNGLRGGTKYFLKVEARDNGDAPTSAASTGSFNTPAESNQWQDVSFSVVTGQSYWDLDDPAGYHIYPAMQKLGLHFIVPTGDTVYLDSEAPRARTVELARYHWQRMYSLPRHVEFHRHVPGYWEKDDHDAWANDCWPTMSAPWMNPLTFKEGLAVFREQVPMGDLTFRTIRWGKGLQIWMVEGRDFRSPNNAPDGPNKLIWGKKQREWLKRTVLASDADFRVLISPTPIVGPDRARGKNDNHSNKAFQTAGDDFRNWTKSEGLKNFYVCCGDRHWQYTSVDLKTQLREFSCGPASDKHAGGSPGRDPRIQPFHRVKGGFLTVNVFREEKVPTVAIRHHDVHGKVVEEFKSQSK